MKVSEESPRWQWPQAAFAMHRIEEGLHLHSFGNVKTVPCIPIQGRVGETLARYVLARHLLLLVACHWRLSGHGDIIGQFISFSHLCLRPLQCRCLAQTDWTCVRDCKRLLVVVPCVNRRAPTTLVLRRSYRRRRSRDGLEGGTQHSSHPREALRRS